MDPKSYLDRYTNLALTDPINGHPITVPITGYGAGWGDDPTCNRMEVGPKCQKEYLLGFVPALRKAHHGNAKTPCGAKFFFDNPRLGIIPATEDFYPETFVHAFGGKGSPDEIKDTLRLAMAIGRFGFGKDAAGNAPAKPTLAQYAEAFMTLDCNGLVSNFHGVKDVINTSVQFFANAARRRTTIGGVRPGDVVVTHGGTKPYEHVAMIQSWEFDPALASAKSGAVRLRLVEWGEAGDESKHFTGNTPAAVTAGYGKEPNFGIGFPTAGGVKFRYIFAPPGTNDPHGWS